MCLSSNIPIQKKAPPCQFISLCGRITDNKIWNTLTSKKGYHRYLIFGIGKGFLQILILMFKDIHNDISM